jgi:hypothetical protein
MSTDNEKGLMEWQEVLPLDKSGNEILLCGVRPLGDSLIGR